MVKLPEEFQKRMELSLGNEAPSFFEALNNEIPVSIRLNKTKPNISFNDYENIPWCEWGKYLPERPSFTLDPCFHAGTYYVQEASSMLLAQVAKQLDLEKRPLRVLDLCAAPGGKTTLIHDHLHPDSVIIANEVIKSRAQILRENIIKWGTSNIIVTSADPAHIAQSGMTFDLILADAPCSGEGMFRKDKKAIDEWTPENVYHCSLRQQRILDDIIPTLNQGGILVYSTCTFNEFENIDQVIYLKKKYNLDNLKIDLNPNWGVKTIEKENAFGYQAFPHKLKGEGFFFAVLQKKEETKSIKVRIPPSRLKQLTIKELSPLAPFIQSIVLNSVYQHPNGDCYFIKNTLKEDTDIAQANLHIQYCGIKLGNLSKNIFIPEHALALSTYVNEQVPYCELNYDESLSFLRRNLQFIQSDGKGWQIARYQSHNLGWFKQLGNRINNYFPVDIRIRM